MIERVKLDDLNGSGGNYFAAPKENYEFIPSGCAVLDCVIGGGWPLGRIANIVGDSSTGKTLLAIEAASNFVKKFKGGRVWYRETEAAFDKGYAAALGMPVDKVDFGKERLETVEDLFDDLERKIEWSQKNDAPGLYVIDSLDALSDRAELKREIDEGSFGLNKQRKMNELLRRINKPIEECRIALMIISQVRKKIDVKFGDKTTRTGGGALQFYCSQVVYLSHLKNLSRTIKGVKRVIGIRIKAKCKKNKIGLAQRDCEFEIEFGFGVDDVTASVVWLTSVGRLSEAGLSKSAVNSYLDEVSNLDSQGYKERSVELAEIVSRVWPEIETDFLPMRRKL